MGHPTLEALGDLPGAHDPQMAPNARVHTDYDPTQRRVATHAYGQPHRGHPRALSGDVVLDGHPLQILAGSHDSLSIRGQFCRISDLSATVIRDINLWLPHQAHFGWGYVAMNATLWIDLRDHFAMEHQEEWTEQKEQECALNDLERDTEVVYRARIIRRQEDKLIADSKEAAQKTCRLNDGRLAQKGRPVPCPEKTT